MFEVSSYTAGSRLLFNNRSFTEPEVNNNICFSIITVHTGR